MGVARIGSGRVASGIAIVVCLLAGGVAQGTTDFPGTLDVNGFKKLVHVGTFEPAFEFPFLPGPPAPELCFEKACQELTFTVANAGGNDLAVAVGWSTEAEQIDLYLYDGEGNEVGRSTAFATQSRGVVVPPSDGDYKIVLVGNRIGEELPYKLVAQLQPPVPTGDTGTNVRRLLPRLVTPPPTDFHVNGLPVVPSTSIGFPLPAEFFEAAGLTLDQSCYIDEVEGDPSQHRCLRFTNDVANIGEGPLEVEFQVDPDGGCSATQIVTMSDGNKVPHPIPNGCEVHPIHGHFHFQGLARYELRNVTDELVAIGGKVGFCLSDVDAEAIHNHSRKAAEIQPIQAHTYQFPNCHLPVRVLGNAQVNDGLANVMGITQGYGDIYTWDLPDQFVEVTGLCPGPYEVVSTADPCGIVSRDPANDSDDSTGRQWICLADNSVRPITGPDALCPTPGPDVACPAPLTDVTCPTPVP